MLQLKNITKVYGAADTEVHALKGVSLNFRQSEFVAVLGPSGCGKTTMLNIVGGLDRYTEGDLVINGKSTENFKDKDWDTYRNHSIGFVFQSYNLIPHMNILDNVTLSLTLAGVSKSERIAKAKAALQKVGLVDQMKKRPNQLSGGQMQRVAIARAIVNDPDIVLADEPTGALDSETGIQVMDLLKEVAKDRLVIMVTHNEELAKQYATRIVRLFDGCLVSDSMPYADSDIDADNQEQSLPNMSEPSTTTDVNVVNDEQLPEPQSKKTDGKKKRVRMSLWTAFAISAKNLFSKKGRTFLTSFAGSIGIFGITLVLAISAGMSAYVEKMQQDAVGESAITISETTINMDSVMNVMESFEGLEAYPDTQTVKPYANPMNSVYVQNNISEEYVDYIKQMDSSWYKTLDWTYKLKLNVLQQNGDNYRLLSKWSSNSSQMVSNSELVSDNYDVLYKLEGTSGYPTEMTEVALVIDKYNRMTVEALNGLGIPYDALTLEEVPFDKIVGMQYSIIMNDGMYALNSKGLYSAIGSSKYAEAATGEHAINVKIVGILRPKGDKANLWLKTGIGYLPTLSEHILNNAVNSEVGKAQKANTTSSVLTGKEFAPTALSSVESQYIDALKAVGAYEIPTNISISPTDINTKKQITDYLDKWNEQHTDDQIVYIDFAEMVLDMMSTLIEVITYVLVAFSAVSLIVSTVMISVITYTSVVERIKEIGILRSIGASKGDIAGIFNAETTMIGAFAGAIGIIFAAIVGAIVNVVLYNAFEVSNIVQFTPGVVLLMFTLSVGLTLLAGIIPASIAANKDPVVALRTE